MNNREVDALVAEKVMGWVKRISNGFEYWDGEGYKPWIDNWKPSTNIADAWQVVERTKIAIIPQAGFPPKDMQYMAELEGEPTAEGIRTFAETAPMAICLAALKAVGVEDSQ